MPVYLISQANNSSFLTDCTAPVYPVKPSADSARFGNHVRWGSNKSASRYYFDMSVIVAIPHIPL